MERRSQGLSIAQSLSRDGAGSEGEGSSSPITARERSSVRPMAEGECGGAEAAPMGGLGKEGPGRAGLRHGAGVTAGMGMELPGSCPALLVPLREGAAPRGSVLLPSLFPPGKRQPSGTLVAGAGTRPGWGTASGSPSLFRAEGAGVPPRPGGLSKDALGCVLRKSSCGEPRVRAPDSV